MLRRAIFSNARALRAGSVAARTSAALRAQQRVAPAPWASRWYSSEAKEEAKQEAKEEAKEENGEVAELKKKLEAKDKEVIDLKVSSSPPLFPTTKTSSRMPERECVADTRKRTSTSAQSPSSAPSRTARRATKRRPATSRSKSSPRTSSSPSTTWTARSPTSRPRPSWPPRPPRTTTRSSPRSSRASR